LGAVPVIAGSAWTSKGIYSAYALGAVLIVAVSWLDDLHRIPSGIRLCVHATAAAVAIAGVSGYSAGSGPARLDWYGALIALLWVVGLVNAYNFMDGIDGIAAGQAVVAGLGWWLIAGENSFPLGTWCLLAAGASLGFLIHNWPPARIFMGDAGSAFLGYTFAVIPLMFAALTNAAPGPGLLIGILLVWPFVFDTSLTFLRRLARGENVFMAHRSHLYQRVVIAGWSHRAATLLYLGLAAAGGLLAGLCVYSATAAVVVAAASVSLMAAGLWLLVVAQERRYRAGARLASGLGRGIGS
jgi:UDP-N-acetylmuramyl pentapeptide phosphotransferase/UDP-N-acetylglucosamine-1-phosphate transferase